MILKDTGGKGLDNLVKQLEQLAEKQLLVGIPKTENKERGAGMNNASLLYIHEFGARIRVTDKMRGYLAATGLRLKKSTTFIVIPERSTLRATMNENREKYAKIQSEQIKKAVMSGRMTAEQAYEGLGLIIQGDIQAKMQSGQFKPNHPYTVEKKGSSKPLIDTGNLVGSITYVVR